MKKNFSFLFIAVLGLIMLPSFTLAEHGHGHLHGQADSGASPKPAMKMDSTDVFADGVQITFMVMENKMHKGMLQQMKMKDDLEPGTTHDIMVLIRDEKTGREFTDQQVTLKVVGPDEKEQVKPASYKTMMRSYDAYFDLAEPGSYRIFVLFEMGGKKRAVGLSYDR